ncbi:MAG: T9SS type A sorting domain-containing protein [Calditrichota bacterium]
MLDSLEWYFAYSPLLMRSGDGLFLTFFSTERAQQELVWISETGEMREHYNDLFNIHFAYPVEENVVLVQYVSTIEDTFRWDVMSAYTYDSAGVLQSCDTLLTDTIGQYDIFSGVAFNASNDRLIAAVVEAHAIQYPTDYRVRLAFFQDGDVVRVPAIGFGSPPERAYFSRFTIIPLPGGIYNVAIGFNVIRVNELSELRFLAVRFGYPYIPLMKTLALDSLQMVTGLDMYSTDLQVYVAYTTQSSNDNTLRGMYFTGFPVSDIFAADERLAPATPQNLALAAYPNPFNAATRFEYALPIAARVNVNIYDITGRQAAAWNIGQQPAGNHSFYWSADELPSGIYFARLSAGAFSSTHKLVLLK